MHQQLHIKSINRLALLILAVVFFWYLILSMLLLRLPDTGIATHYDIVFNSDIGARISQLTWDGESRVGNMNRHHGAVHIWPVLGRPLSELLSTYFEPTLAKTYSACFLLALMGGVGVAAFSRVMLKRGISAGRALSLVIVYCLFSSSMIAAIPEFFGLVASLHLISLAVYCSDLRTPTKIPLLLILALIASATTTTAGFLPLMCLVFLVPAIANYQMPGFQAFLTRRVLLSFAIVAALILTLLVSVVWKYKTEGGWKSMGLENTPLVVVTDDRVSDPIQAITYFAGGFVYPAVAPNPKLVDPHPYQGGKTSNGKPVTSFDPWDISDYGFFNGMAALAWIFLFCMSAIATLANHQYSTVARILLLWIFGNITFHLFWGDEVFLYTPHWSWALFAITVIGSQYLPRKLLIFSTGIIIAGQVQTIVASLALIHSIAPALS